MHSATFPSFVTTSIQSWRGRPALLIASVCAVAMLAGCATRSTRAPVTDLTGGQGSAASVAGSYVVKPGDTLYQIAQRHGMDVATLSGMNSISDPTQLRVGQVLRVSGGSAPVGSPSVVPATPAIPTPPVAPTTPSRANDANLIAWGWPVQGKIIQGFNSETKGIDIQGAVGEPILAAASGTVVYAGNGVRGMGNLVLLKHSNNFITAYAHNEKLLVKSGQTVKKGEKVALLGQSDTSSPRLHFEIRRSGVAMNPLSYLPKQ